jgi:hypothetical protein
MESQLYQETSRNLNAGSCWRVDQPEQIDVSWIDNVVKETAIVCVKDGKIVDVHYCGDPLVPHLFESDQPLWECAELAYQAQLAGEPMPVDPVPTRSWPMARDTRDRLVERFNLYDLAATWITTCPACAGYVSTVFGYALPGERPTYMEAQEIILRALYLVERVTLSLDAEYRPRADIADMVINYANKVWHSHETGYFSHGDQFKALLVGVQFPFETQAECWEFLIHSIILMMAWRDDQLDDSAEMIDQIVRLLAV